MKTFSLTVENIMEMAAQKAKLYDFGDEDFLLPLRKLLDSFNEEYGSDIRKKYSFGYTLADLLSKRLYIRDNFKSYKEIINIPVKRPLFITGLPRTGTTLMHNLLSQNQYWRVLPYWELVFPYYRADMGENFEKHAIRLSEQLIKGLYSQYPDLIRRHETRAEGPEECVHLLRYTFYSNSFAVEWELPGYLKWYIEQDLTDSYRYYRDLLKLLLWRKAGAHLLSKCPAHLLGLKAIFNVFPDANVVWMHRNPCKSIASVISLFSVFRAAPTEYDDFIDLYLDYFKKSLNTVMDVARTYPNQVKSIDYKKLVANPHEVVREIYSSFGYPVDNKQEELISQWLEENPRHKHGVHKYSLEDFGLSDADIKNRFSRYYDEYDNLL